VTRAGAGIKATAQDPADLAAKIRRMAALPIEERRAMGERGRAYVREHHDMPILARRLAEVIRDVIAAQAGSTRG
jgi:glycosyltransferase involved in cell wall biosynthesis